MTDAIRQAQERARQRAARAPAEPPRELTEAEKRQLNTTADREQPRYHDFEVPGLDLLHVNPPMTLAQVQERYSDARIIRKP